MTTAAIVSIGDEVVLGQICDTNAAWLSQQLIRRGILSVMHITAGDDAKAITEALRHAAGHADLVLATGGLGPTDDDLTRQALADLVGVELVLHETSLEAIREFFRGRGRPMADRNRLQAMLPAGAVALDNPFGTAPGIRVEYRGVTIFCVPGVPVEMRGLYERHIEPFLDSTCGPGKRCIVTAKLNTFGMGESNVAELLGELMQRDRNPTVGTTVSDGIIAVRIRSEFADAAPAQREIEAMIDEVQRRLGPIVFGRDDETLAQSVAKLLKQTGRTVATAESCTGGLLSTMLTDIPGSSGYYHAGWITYANAIKQQELGVPGDLLEQHGAVSEPVAIAMADAARRKADADYALAITGIAGPDGGTADKPVGTVWIALADRSRRTIAVHQNLPGDRAAIRDRSAKAALNMLRLRLLDSEG